MSDKKLLTAAELKKKNLRKLETQIKTEKDPKKQRVLTNKERVLKFSPVGRELVNTIATKVINEKGPPSVITKDARINRIQKELSKVMNAERMAKGGRVGLKSGSKVCKLAKRGKGRAYGKNS
jgi:hypothetical protein